jgi:hypothetical protein
VSHPYGSSLALPLRCAYRAPAKLSCAFGRVGQLIEEVER